MTGVVAQSVLKNPKRRHQRPRTRQGSVASGVLAARRFRRTFVLLASLSSLDLSQDQPTLQTLFLIAVFAGTDRLNAASGSLGRMNGGFPKPFDNHCTFRPQFATATAGTTFEPPFQSDAILGSIGVVFLRNGATRKRWASITPGLP